MQTATGMLSLFTQRAKACVAEQITDDVKKKAAEMAFEAARLLTEASLVQGCGLDIHSMSPNRQLAARASYLAYMPADQRETLSQASFFYSHDLSSIDHAIWVQEATKTLLVSFKGTDSLRDMEHNLEIIIAAEKYNSDRFHNRQLISALKERFSGFKIVLSGHSLGGRIAIATLLYHHADIHQVYTFNEGARKPLRLGKRVDRKFFGSNIPGDPISHHCTRGINSQQFKSPSSVSWLGCHAIQSFLWAADYSEMVWSSTRVVF